MHCGRRLGHRPHRHRLRPDGLRRDPGDLRGHPHDPGPRAHLAPDPELRGERVLHGADGDPGPDEARRRIPDVVLKGERPEGGYDPDLVNELSHWAGQRIGAIAKPEDIRFTDNLPKTRSGKIMFDKLDANGDGKITQQEAKAKDAVARQFDKLDANRDGALSRSELGKATSSGSSS
ncbi:MAG: hypothetical protein BRD57_02260 [Proteobacteria bacterium SW_6_67_9]|nr:MAG: hypothetical protein BRD57_02260 [Proteobacteria bacterium SW_6_67_9]